MPDQENDAGAPAAPDEETVTIELRGDALHFIRQYALAGEDWNDAIARLVADNRNLRS